jgi:hypothetical protein
MGLHYINMSSSFWWQNYLGASKVFEHYILATAIKFLNEGDILIFCE